MNYHLGKPVFKDELISAIAVMLRNRRYRNNTMNSQNFHEPEQNKTKFWETLGNEKVLDLSTINSLKEIGGLELIESLFETFIADSEKMIGELENAVVREEMKQYDHIMHTLKGSSGSVGANKMFVLSSYINQCSHNGIWPENESWLQIFKAVFADTANEMKNLFQK